MTSRNFSKDSILTDEQIEGEIKTNNHKRSEALKNAQNFMYLFFAYSLPFAVIGALVFVIYYHINSDKLDDLSNYAISLITFFVGMASKPFFDYVMDKTKA